VRLVLDVAISYALYLVATNYQLLVPTIEYTAEYCDRRVVESTDNRCTTRSLTSRYTYIYDSHQILQYAELVRDLGKVIATDQCVNSALVPSRNGQLDAENEDVG
jgi:hypothetical protein